MRGCDAAAFGDQGRKRVHDFTQNAQAAIGGDDTDEIAHGLAETLTGQHRERRFGRGRDVDQRRLEQPAEIGGCIDQPAKPLHLPDHVVELV